MLGFLHAKLYEVTSRRTVCPSARRGWGQSTTSYSNNLVRYSGYPWAVRVLICYKAMAKVTGSLQKSTEIMKLSNSLIRLPQISEVMRNMRMEMEKVSRHQCSQTEKQITFTLRLASWTR